MILVIIPPYTSKPPQNPSHVLLISSHNFCQNTWSPSHLHNMWQHFSQFVSCPGAHVILNLSSLDIIHMDSVVSEQCIVYTQSRLQGAVHLLKTIFPCVFKVLQRWPCLTVHRGLCLNNNKGRVLEMVGSGHSVRTFPRLTVCIQTASSVWLHFYFCTTSSSTILKICDASFSVVSALIPWRCHQTHFCCVQEVRFFLSTLQPMLYRLQQFHIQSVLLTVSLNITSHLNILFLLFSSLFSFVKQTTVTKLLSIYSLFKGFTVSVMGCY